MTMGEKIRQARINAGLTQRELADKVGVKWSAIHKYETGMVVNLKQETIARLSEALGVRPAWLLGYTDEEPVAPQITKADAELIEAYHRAPTDIQYAVATLLARYKKGPAEGTY